MAMRQRSRKEMDQSADSSDGEAPEKPEGDDQSADSSDGGAPEKSEGDDQSADSSDGGAPEKSEGDDQSADSSDGEAPEKPDGNGQSAEAEEISLSDIQEGDIVSITLDEDGNAASITVMSMEMGGQGQVLAVMDKALQDREVLVDSLRVWTAILR